MLFEFPLEHSHSHPHLYSRELTMGSDRSPKRRTGAF